MNSQQFPIPSSLMSQKWRSRSIPIKAEKLREPSCRQWLFGRAYESGLEQKYLHNKLPSNESESRAPIILPVDQDPIKILGDFGSVLIFRHPNPSRICQVTCSAAFCRDLQSTCRQPLPSPESTAMYGWEVVPP